MGYYCTVPQCTSLAGKTKNVKFHRFPRDEVMADKWNTILKRGKPVTIYSKVCSLHFTQADYNVTTMGQWKTLSKDAVPSQNLPKLNPDGTVMVIRKSRIINKYKEIKKEVISDAVERWSPKTVPPLVHGSAHPPEHHDNISFSYRLQAINAIANNVSPHTPEQVSPQTKPKKQDAFMQTDPIKEEEDSQMNTSFETDKSYSSDLEYQYKTQAFQDKKYETPKNYTKDSDYIPQTTDEYNKEAEKYALLGRKSQTTFDKMDYPKITSYEKIPEVYTNYSEKAIDTRQEYVYESPYPSSVDTLRNQQQNLQLLQEHHRLSENQNFFNESHIKREIEFNNEEEKFLYEHKNQHNSSTIYNAAPRMPPSEHQVKQEPDPNACETVPPPQASPYYSASEHSVNGYPHVPRPGPELLIAKQNALAAHTQLWQNTMKRPFFYSETPRYNTPPIVHRYEDLSRILQ